MFDAIKRFFSRSNAEAKPIAQEAPVVVANHSSANLIISDLPHNTAPTISAGTVKPPPWIVEAQKLIGLREGVGSADNPTVLRLYADAGHPEVQHDSVAWCAAFVGAMLKRGGAKPNGNLSARSYETYGVGLVHPVYGCIGVKKRSGKNAPAWQGHVGFVVAANATTVWLLGGNQGDAVKVAAFERSEFTAFRYPAGFTALPFLPTSYAATAHVSES